MPSVSDLTREILSGESFVWEKSKPLQLKTAAERLGPRIVLPEFYGESDDAGWNEHVRPILLLLSWLNVQAERRYASWPGRKVNYEDMAYLAEQLFDDLSDNYENPALIPFREKALGELSDLLVDTTWSTSSKNSRKEVLQELTGKAVDYIRYAVALLLDQPAEGDKSAYLNLFVEAASDPGVTNLDIFTLNHDRLVESFFTKNAKHPCLADGFVKAEDGFRRWDPSSFDSEAKVRLYKLHGAANWHRFRPEGSQNPNNAWAGELIGIGSSPRYKAMGDPPLLLAGTFNKLLSYTEAAYLELHYRFHRALLESDHLIICGYGFGDKGINQRIVERMTSTRSCRLLVIDPSSFAGARGAIYGKLDGWRAEGRFVHWQNRLEDRQSVSWKKIRSDFLDCHLGSAHSGK